MAHAAYRSYKRLNSAHAAGSKAITVWVCRGCEVQHRRDRQPDRKKPHQCIGCGRMDFDEFPSVTEATHWAQLRMLERKGKLTDLRRQVPFALYAWTPVGDNRRKVATYIADFVWFTLEGERIIADSKPAAGVDDFAGLKLRWMEAQGDPVTILTSSTILRGD